MQKFLKKGDTNLIFSAWTLHSVDEVQGYRNSAGALMATTYGHKY